jgi:hypothetical protein
VWVHAARAVGRLTSELELLVGTVIDWSSGNNPVLRQRATTAFASMSPKRLGLYAGQLLAMLRGEEDASSLEALALATPYLMVSRRGLWDELVARVLGGAGGPRVASALAKGLGCLWRRSRTDRDVEAALWSLRERARAARPTSLDEARQWLEVTAETDVVEQAERDPLDLERGLENLVRVAAQHDDPEADARAARIASYLGFAFEEARTTSERSTRLTSRAAAMNAVEATARSLAVQLWSPVVATRSPDDPGPEIHLDEAWQRVARGPAQLLELVESARRGEVEDDEAGQLALEVLAVRVGGYVLDACGEATELGPGRGRVVYDTCQWLRRMQGLVDGDRTFPGPLEEALSALLWRLVDSTRGTALGEVNDQEWLGPFAAWWSLVIDRPDVLRKLASALPMMSADALEVCCEQAEALRELLGAGPEPSWADEITIFLEVLHADDTELSVALARLIEAIEGFEKASGTSRELDALCLALVSSAERLNAALTDPMRGLRKSASDGPSDDALPSEATENAPRVASLLGRAVRQRESAVLDVWLPSLVPLVAALVDFAVRGAIRRTPPAPPSRRPAVQPVEGYELVRPLGEGGIGSVWLVRKSGADRLFVLKIPKADALASANEVEREGMLASFVEEAKALAGLYHPNVANISDRGVAHGMPFLVLDYLIGADLKQYSSARLMELHELRQVVPDVCAGLAALHRAGLVHRDIKPANLWLRLPLEGEEGFDPHRHRDPAKVAPLSTVLIDFGMVRAFTIAKEASGRLVAGTPGYIAPEQVLDPAELDARADVYSLVASIYNVTTGRAFFDDLTTQRDKVMAHMKRDPFDDASRLKPFPAAVAKVLRAGTAHAAADRPHPIEFARAFVAAL